MMRYFIYLQYDGTRYHGWQIQPNGISVQEELQNALSTLLNQPIDIVGAGRTDAGVHARMMVAHFDVTTPIDTLLAPHSLSLEQLTYKLNRFLPRDISIYKIEPVDSEMHARFSATARTYHYYIHQEKNPFLEKYSCEIRYPLDFDAMNEAASHLLQVEDFGAFCKSGSNVKTTLCHVTEAFFEEQGAGSKEQDLLRTPHSWCFVITANRFLRNMVRAVVGTLIEVGRHRITIDEFDNIVAGKQRAAAGESMPGNALFLWDVAYSHSCRLCSK